MTNRTLMDSKPSFTFLIFFSPWEQVAAFLFLFSLVRIRLVLLRSLSLLFTPWFTTFFGVGGGNTLSRIQWEKNLYQFLFQVHFYPFLSQNKLFMESTHTVFCGKKETFCSLHTAGS